MGDTGKPWSRTQSRLRALLLALSQRAKEAMFLSSEAASPSLNPRLDTPHALQLTATTNEQSNSYWRISPL